MIGLEQWYLSLIWKTYKNYKPFAGSSINK